MQLAAIDERHLPARSCVAVAHTMYECSVCGERMVGDTRCAQDNRFCRALTPAATPATAG